MSARIQNREFQYMPSDSIRILITYDLKEPSLPELIERQICSDNGI